MNKRVLLFVTVLALCARPGFAQGGKLTKAAETAVSRAAKTTAENSVLKAASVKNITVLNGTLRSAALERKLRSGSALAYDHAAARAGANPLARLTVKYAQDLNNAFALTNNYISGFYQKRVEPTLYNPKWTDKDGEHFYRGMLITAEELADILQNGLQRAKTNWNTGAAQGEHIISFSTDIYEARSYIFQQGGVTKKGRLLGVVFETRRTLPATTLFEDAQLNSTNTIYHCRQDVPASAFTNVYLQGEYGLESLSAALRKAAKGELQSNKNWVNQFDPEPESGGFFR